MKAEFDYYGNIIAFEAHGECDGPCINIISSSSPIEDDAEERDIIFHIREHLSYISEAHFLKTGTFLY